MNRAWAAPTAFVLVLLPASASCVPEAADGRFGCDPLRADQCPAGYLCQRRGGEPEARCYREAGPHCGDGVVDPGETCDGSDLGAITCQALGSWRGTPSCDRCQATVDGCSGASSLAFGLDTACAADRGGRAWCWVPSSDPYGRAGSLGDAPVDQVTAGRLAGCTLDTSGQAACWGWSPLAGVGMLGSMLWPAEPVRGDHTFTRLTSGEWYHCGLDTAGAVWCWGQIFSFPEFTLEPTRVSGEHRFTQVQAGRGSLCALDPEGRAWCWGRNASGELGNGSQADAAEPTPVDADLAFLALTMGPSHACGLDVDHRTWCWGYRGRYPGREDLPLVLSPREEAVGLELVGLRAGLLLTCGLDREGRAHCWYGDQLDPWNALPGWVLEDLVLSLEHDLVCGLTARGEALCAGWLGSGLAGLEPAGRAPRATGWTAASLSIGRYLGCGLDRDGGVSCWGSDFLGRAASSFEILPVPEPVPVQGLRSDVSQVAVVDARACALFTTGRLFCWGYNQAGELGIPAPWAYLPTPVETDARFTRVWMGSLHTCALDDQGRAYCWGSNASGQLGNGTTEDAAAPTAVGSELQFVDGVASEHVTCLLDALGRAHCMGNNQFGQVGVEGIGLGQVTRPMPVSGGLRFEQLVMTLLATCGLDAEGQVWCWGAGNSGELTNPFVTQSTAPVPVAEGFRFRSIMAGARHLCGLDDAGAAWCWGANDRGQLGRGPGPATTVPGPAPVAGSLVFRALATTLNDTTCGLTVDDQVWCWGDNAAGQAGIDSRVSIPVPVEAP